MDRCNSKRIENEKNYEVINYAERLPFRIHNVTRKGIMDEYGRQKDVLEHWHRELEVGYTFAGHAEHYIDGKVHRASPGTLFVTNPESIHKIVSDINIDESVDVVATVLIINPEFVEQLIPDLKKMYFLTEVHSEKKVIEKIMRVFFEYADHQKMLQPFEEMKLMGLMYQLMYLICKDALVSREEAFPINNEKNMERLRGIMMYVNTHYTEPIRQQEVAERFYFTREYFSRFFRKNTGMTFKEYLMKVRVRAAKEEILETEKSMLEIAMDSGFTDSRSLIHAFKEVYDITPYQFKKQNG